MATSTPCHRCPCRFPTPRWPSGSSPSWSRSWAGRSSSARPSPASPASSGAAFDLVAAVLYVVVVTLVAASALAYLTSRMGFSPRAQSPARTRAELEALRAGAVAHRARAVIPGGRARDPHDAAVGRAAGVPRPRVVLLIDDPPEPSTPAPARLLAAPSGCRRDRGAARRAAAALRDGAGDGTSASGGEASVEQTRPASRSIRVRRGAGWRDARSDYDDRRPRRPLPRRARVSRPRRRPGANAEALRAALDEGASCRPTASTTCSSGSTWIFGAGWPASSASGTCRCRTSPTRR